MKFRYIFASLPLLVGTCYINLANASSFITAPILKVNVDSGLRQYITNHQGSSMGKNMMLDYTFYSQYSPDPAFYVKAENLNEMSFKQAISNLDDSMSKLIGYEGLNNIRFRVDMEKQDEEVDCNASFDQTVQYKTITLNLSLDDGSGHCKIQVETTE